jgi:carboxylesterase
VAIGDAFDLVGDGQIGVVCVHGFTGTPYEVRYLGERLHAEGFSVHGVRLPGHGTRIEDLDETRWTEWADAVEDAFDSMRMLCERVAVVGQSLGGLLSLHLAAHRTDVAAVATLAAPLWLDGLAGKVAAWAERGTLPVRRIPKLGGSDIRDRRARAENPCYDAIPTRALGELLRFMHVVDAELPSVSCPVLVLHGRRDHTAPLACAARIADAVRARRTRILPDSFHLIAADVERDVVAAEVVNHLRRELPCAT